MWLNFWSFICIIICVSPIHIKYKKVYLQIIDTCKSLREEHRSKHGVFLYQDPIWCWGLPAKMGFSPQSSKLANSSWCWSTHWLPPLTDICWLLDFLWAGSYFMIFPICTSKFAKIKWDKKCRVFIYLKKKSIPSLIRSWNLLYENHTPIWRHWAYYTLAILMSWKLCDLNIRSIF